MARRTSSASTRERLLDAAEALFAEAGFNGASLRPITEQAGANLAAVNYHFGSKEALYEAVVLRRIRPMNEARLQRLAEAERIGPDVIDLRLLLDLLLRPIVALATAPTPGGHPFPRVISRALIDPEPFMRSVMTREFSPLFRRLEPHLRRLLPELDRPTLGFRLRYVLGATNMIFAANPFLPGLRPSLPTASAPDVLLEQLLVVSEAVLRAPPPALTS